ncbi:hydroxypyruvate isomerase [Capsulimonas corticalis]|uniref:Hydroxypyruvate isomerase n=1 Tax=Capsulimonas corticalis TaxID=2219043 RepID=A0A402CUM7_9BACT|nr:TIM barrel protein [Capsulimonas corticalis]BDI29030.1 hydroxypyruvate isomerase [Capsulimonas corticalis]
MNTSSSSRITRRGFLTQAAALSLTAAALPQSRTSEAAPPPRLPAPQYTLSVNLELMFPGDMPFDQRLQIVVDAGAKAYSFWGHEGKPLDKMRAIQDKSGIACASIIGPTKTGWGAGLTKTGEEKAFLDDFADSIKVAKRLGAENLITFVGVTQPDIPWQTQHDQIVTGLKAAGDLAGAAGVYATLEPLNGVENAQMAIITSARAYEIAKEVNHERVKVDFDLYHRQLGEGNLLDTLKDGIAKGYVRFVEVGDVPGRFEPGTGEVNYPRIFQVLREIGYAGYIGMEHRTTTTPKEAFDKVKALAGLA